MRGTPGSLRRRVVLSLLTVLLLPGPPAFSAVTPDPGSPNPGASVPAGGDGKLREIQTEEKHLLEIKQDLLRQIQRNRLLEEKIEKDRKIAEKLRTRKMQQLITIYEKMAPRTAAAQINMMSESLASVLISGMNPRKASRIMRYVDPTVAVRISSDLASQPVPPKNTTGSP
ncbi:MAG: MotE family protein [Leptospirales bacterium]